MTVPLRVLSWPADANRVEQPYNWLLAESVRANGVQVEEFRPRAVLSNPDVWHLHWPEAVLNDPLRARATRNVVGLLGLVRLARLRGVAIVWTVHNLHTHDRLYPRLEGWFWRAFPHLLDGYICLSESSRVAALERLPALRSRHGSVIPLGDYRGVYPDDISPLEARRRLGIGLADRVVTFLGQIRPYKGVPELIRRFRALPDPEARLVVAGRPNSPALASEVHAAAGDDARVLLHLGFVADEDLQVFLRAADVVALPFVDILNSASAMLSLSYDRPVLVPARGSMAELRDRVGDRWVRVYDGSLTTEAIADAIAWSRSLPAGSAPLAAYSWQRIGELTADTYRAAVEARRAGA